MSNLYHGRRRASEDDRERFELYEMIEALSGWRPVPESIINKKAHRSVLNYGAGAHASAFPDGDAAVIRSYDTALDYH